MITVPWAYFIFMLSSLAFAANALSPVRRTSVASGISFFAGWLTSELALFHVGLQAVVTAIFVSLGALHLWPGYAGLGLAALTWTLLVLSMRRSRRAGPVMREALGLLPAPESSGSALEKAPIAEQLHPPFFAPFGVRRRGVTRTRDIVFTEGEGYRLRLDLYRSERAPARAPVLLQVHGGAWVLGSKDQQGIPLMKRMAERGWLGVNANYRLSPRATFPDPVIDLKRAIVWIREHAEEIGADPSFIVITGGSAGGHLSALVALTGNDPAFQPGFEDKDTSIQGCVPFYGIYDFTNRHGHWKNRGLARILERQVLKKKLADAKDDFDRASPMHHVTDKRPPFLVIHGDSDTLVPVDEARRFVELLRTAGTEPALYAEIPGAQHAFDVFSSVRTEYVLAGVEQFLEWLHSRHLSAESAPPLREGGTALVSASGTHREGSRKLDSVG